MSFLRDTQSTTNFGLRSKATSSLGDMEDCDIDSFIWAKLGTCYDCDF